MKLGGFTHRAGTAAGGVSGSAPCPDEKRRATAPFRLESVPPVAEHSGDAVLEPAEPPADLPPIGLRQIGRYFPANRQQPPAQAEAAA